MSCAPCESSFDVVFEPFERKPFDLFYFETSDRTRYVGKKTEARLMNGSRLKCCAIGAEMILGIAVRDQVSAEGVTVFYRPLDPSSKQEAFRALVSDPTIDLYYPFPHLAVGARAERTAPAGYWVPADALDAGEATLRAFTLDLVREWRLDGARLYDPACSTGAFLASLKGVWPGTHTIGQDASAAMVEHARPRLDEVHVGDCWDSPVPRESVDVAFIRMLNFDVVTTERAYGLLPRIANRVRNGGRIVVFGHTPVLVACPWFERLGLVVRRRSGAWNGGEVAFQYYVLEKEMAVPEIAGPSSPAR